MNRIIALLVGLLVLLIFMDVQAKRHRTNTSLKRGIPDDPALRLYPSAEEPEESIAPLKGSVESIFTQPADQEFPLSNTVSSQEEADPVRLKPLEENELLLYFVRFRKSRSEMVRVKRKTDGSVSLADVLRLLGEGPRVDERGLLNTFSSNIRIHSAKLHDGIAMVDVSEEIGRNGEHVIRDRLAQLALTLFQFPEVRGIRLFVDGEPVRKLGSSGYPVPELILQPNRKIASYP